ncbi:MAG: beta-propeller domain-containing protein [Planctomycetota bacterium]|nr:MAG: beta-propeller domain-containing protein [Planctomycetota bacterium]
MRKIRSLVLILTCIAIIGVSCMLFPIFNPPQTQVAGMKTFSSAEQMRAYLVEQALTQYKPTQSTPPLPMPTPSEDLSNEAGGDTPDDYSTTNIQEIGVDESDIVKNNGQNIYVLDGSAIHIIQATPADSMKELATVQLESAGDSLYLRNKTLVVLSHEYTYYLAEWDYVTTAQPIDIIGDEWNDGSQTTVTIIDVSDPANPVNLATTKFEGNLVSSRMIDNRLYLILTTTPRLFYGITQADLDKMSLNDWLPDYQTVSSDGSVKSGNIMDWQDCYRPETPNGYGITMVVTMDVDNPNADFEPVAISADAGIIYASTDALYITDTEYNYFIGGSVEDTIVHKFDFTDTGTAYIASGLVPGRPLNQYSLGEYESYLRIATTIRSFEFNANGSTNNVYILAESGGTLEVVGKIENIAPGESIYAARFIGTRGFLVTFKKIDPLFTLDLSDPTNPQVRGELKVPGYSDHIQLLDENHLLTIGKDAQDMGSFAWFQGVQLSIFDVTNFTNPQLLHKEIIGGRGTHSEANDNPKAFNYFASRGVLAFPIDLYSGDTTGSQYGQHTFTGLYVYRVSVENGFEFLGGIASTDGLATNGCYWGYYGFTRGVFIGDVVYSATQLNITAASLDSIDTIISQVTFDNSSLVQDCHIYEPVVALPVGGGIQ